MGTHPIFESDFDCLTDGMILRLASFRLSTRQISLSIGQKNPYRVLGVSVNASKKEVKKAYRSKVLDCHPDRFPDDPKKKAQFIKVQEAYEEISSGQAQGPSEKRTDYQRGSFSGYASDRERPKKGFDFDYNYRQRMRARAEWEKIQKERKARNDEHAYGHYAKWSKDAEGREEFESFYRADNYQRAREAHRQHRHDFQTETTEQRYRRAQRVQENINKGYQFRSHEGPRPGTEEKFTFQTDAEWRKKRHEEFETIFQQNKAKREQDNKQVMTFISFLFGTLFIALLISAYNNQRPEALKRLSRSEMYAANLDQWNLHTRKHFQRSSSERELLSEEENQKLLEHLEKNSASLRHLDKGNFGGVGRLN